jgi:hypothetical protein
MFALYNHVLVLVMLSIRSMQDYSNHYLGPYHT